MIRDPDELQVGRIVFLEPYTKQASQTCYRRIAVDVAEDPKKHWPRILVHWTEEDGGHWEMIHKDNIRLKRASAATSRTEGDATRDSGGDGGAAPRPMTTNKPKEIKIPDGMEQGTLF